MDNPPQASDLSFQVMPQDGTQQPQAPMPPAPTGSGPALPTEPGHSDSKRYIYIAIAIVLVFAIGAAAYFLLGPKKSDTKIASKLPKVWMQQFFGKETCDNPTACGDDADPDADGLSNYDEFKSGTNPTLPDSDADGLADGDEVNVYKTDPNLKYTDRRDIVASNDWTDSFQIKGGYDPLTPGLKLTDARLAQIAADTAQFTLHAPTTQSLTPAPVTPPPPPSSDSSMNNSPAPKTVTVMIQDGKFNPSTITINQGDTVVWLNKDNVAHHVASDPHPTHTDLPGLESSDLANAKTYSFKFISIGTWGYHDHLNSATKGTVIVK